MSTLRNDLEQADSPLTIFVPGVPWPHVDPDAYGADVRKDWVRELYVLCFLLQRLRFIAMLQKLVSVAHFCQFVSDQKHPSLSDCNEISARADTESGGSYAIQCGTTISGDWWSQ